VCRGSFEECNQAHAGTCPQNQAQGKQARDRRAEAALAGCLDVLESSVCALNVKKAPVANLAQKGRIAKGATLSCLGYNGRSQKQALMYINALQHTACIPHSCHLSYQGNSIHASHDQHHT